MCKKTTDLDHAEATCTNTGWQLIIKEFLLYTIALILLVYHSRHLISSPCYALSNTLKREVFGFWLMDLFIPFMFSRIIGGGNSKWSGVHFLMSFETTIYTALSVYYW